MFYVYVLKSRVDGEIYIGRTDNLQQRLEAYRNGLSYSIRRRLPVELAYYEAYRSEKGTMLRERRLKYYGKALGQLKGRIEHSLCAVKGAG